MSIGERLFLIVGLAILVAALALIGAMMIDVGIGADDQARSVSDVTLTE